MRKLTAFILSLMLMIPVASVSADVNMDPPVSDKLFAYYSFNEIVNGMIVDAMGKNHGELLRGATVVHDDERGLVLSLDGQSAYVKLPDDLLTTLGDLTISVWYKWTDEDYRNWSRVYDLGAGTRNYYMLTPQSGDGTIRFEAKVDDQGEIVNGGDSVNGKWIHVAVTVGGGKITQYVNGEVVDENDDYSSKASDMGSTDGNFIGRSQYPDPYFAGLIDDMAIYSAVLTPAQIKQLMDTKFNTPDSAKATVTPPVARPVYNTNPNGDGMYARYTFNEIVDGKVLDDVNGNNGTVFNGATIANDPDRGNVLALDGKNQYILLPDGITKGLNAVTIAAWYKWTDPDDRHWSRVWDLGSDTNDYFMFTPRSGDDTIRFESKTSAWGSDILNGGDSIHDKWVHVAAVVANGNIVWYVNGEVAEEFGVDVKPSDLGDSDQNFLGRSQYTADAYFMGYIDDFVLYNKALSAAEIGRLMNSDFRNIRGAVTLPATVAPVQIDGAAAPQTVEQPAVVTAAPTTTAPTTADNTVILIIVCAAVIIVGAVVLKIRKSKAK